MQGCRVGRDSKTACDSVPATRHQTRSLPCVKRCPRGTCSPSLLPIWLPSSSCSPRPHPSALSLQHYAAKALENVLGLGGPWAQQLSTVETMGRLLQVGRGAWMGLGCSGVAVSSGLSQLAVGLASARRPRPGRNEHSESFALVSLLQSFGFQAALPSRRPYQDGGDPRDFQV